MNPFHLPERTVISLSGGSPSAYMLYRVLEANSGRLPPGVVVIFCNTGAEFPETYDFVERISLEWDVPVTWLEFTAHREGKNWIKWFKVVNYATANRDYQPFLEVIRMRNALPNVKMRFCTEEMKVKTANRYVIQALEWLEYRNAVGLRYDEPNRVGKMMRRVAERDNPTPVQKRTNLFGDEEKIKQPQLIPLPPGETPIMPLALARVTREMIDQFWAKSPFDLGIPSYLSNCTLCFLKGAREIAQTIRERPESAAWWIAQEQRTDLGKNGKRKRFKNPKDRPSYKELERIALESTMFDGLLDEPRIACEGNCTD